MALTLPTTKQAALLRTLEARPATIHNGDPAHPDIPGTAAVVRARLNPLAARGWLTVPITGNGSITPTHFGLVLAADREALDVWRTGAPERAGIRVERRSRGGKNIRGRGQRNHDGRNVTCVACREDRRERGTRPDYWAPVWYSNEANAQRDAEIAAGRHYREHLSGEGLPALPEGP